MNTRSQTAKMVATTALINMKKDNVRSLSVRNYSKILESLNPDGKQPVTRQMERCGKALSDVQIIVNKTLKHDIDNTDKVYFMCELHRFINTNIYIRKCFDNYRTDAINRFIKAVQSKILELRLQIQYFDFTGDRLLRTGLMTLKDELNRAEWIYQYK